MKVLRCVHLSCNARATQRIKQARLSLSLSGSTIYYQTVPNTLSQLSKMSRGRPALSDMGLTFSTLLPSRSSTLSGGSCAVFSLCALLRGSIPVLLVDLPTSDLRQNVGTRRDQFLLTFRSAGVGWTSLSRCCLSRMPLPAVGGLPAQSESSIFLPHLPFLQLFYPRREL